MQFGFTLKPDHTLERTLALTRQAEAAGFDYGWLFDSHVLWREPYVLLTLMAQATTRLRLGTCVTNPATREPSVTASALAVLDEVSGGRMDLGIGRGDSARRVLGKPPTTMATLEEAIVVIKALVEGRTVAYEGTDLHLPWAGRWTLPVWVAGYGPMALAMTGRVADGIILQLADPDLIRWFVGQVREAAAGAGRDPSSIAVQAAAAGYVGPREVGRERTRWFPALVSNHVVDLVNKYPREQLPAALTGYIRDREGYDYLHHAEVGSSNAAFVGDEVTDRFCLLGPAEEHVAKLHELAEAGVDQFNLYLMNGDEEAQLEAYGRDVIPAFALASAGRPDAGDGPHGVTRHHRSSRPPSRHALWGGPERSLARIGYSTADGTWPPCLADATGVIVSDRSVRPHRRFVLAIAGGAIVAFAALAPSSPTIREARAAAGVNLDQWATLDHAWQNGNLNGNNTRYPEGGIVPFRLAVEGLKAGAHTIRIQYDFTAGGHKAYDFLARYNGWVSPPMCGAGGGGVSSMCPSLPGSSSAAFPSDPFTTDGLSVAGAEWYSGVDRRLTIWGGTISSISGPSHAGPTGGNSTAEFVVHFTSKGSAVLLAWGGHLAQSRYWNLAAGGVA